MMIGLFVVTVDATAVVVATPTVMADLQTDHDGVMWVTSSYLLAYVVPLLAAARLGDRFGPRRLYLVGVGVFTAASAWCALAAGIESLIAARVVQGIGAALLTPQIMSVITRTWPPERRGAAQSIWGGTAAVATFAGPLAGGVLVDTLGWRAIFAVNVPVGVLAVLLARRRVPELPIRPHPIGAVDVTLSGAAILLVVVALQQGQDGRWAPWVWSTMLAGLVLAAAFVGRQSVTHRAALIPLDVFRDRNFSLCCVGVLVASLVTTAMMAPAMFYAQAGCALTPLQSGLVLAPIPVVGGVLAPWVGQVIDRAPPAPVIGAGFAMLSAGLFWLAADMSPQTPMWRLIGAFAAMGVGLAFVWIPLAATSARNLPAVRAGAASGVYNAAQQLGAVLGSAGVAALMAAHIPADTAGGPAPAGTAPGISAAMGQTMLLPAGVAVIGVLVALLMADSRRVRRYEDAGVITHRGSPADIRQRRLSASLLAATQNRTSTLKSGEPKW